MVNQKNKFDYNKITSKLILEGNVIIYDIDNEAEIKKLSILSYVDLATEIIFNFCSPSLEKNKLKNLVQKSYKNF